MSTEVYRKLFIDKCPPTNEREKIYASIILAVSEDLEKIKLQTTETIKAIKMLAKILRDMGNPAENESETVEAEGQGPKDQTPFPANVKAGSAGTAGPLPDEPVAQAAPPVAPPVVENFTKKPSKNGSKDATQS